MRAFLAALVLALFVASPVSARPKIACTVDPLVAPAGSVFTVSCVGASGRLGTEVYWYITPGTWTVEDEVDPPPSGKFSLSRQIDLTGTGIVIIYSNEWSSYTSTYVRFTVT